MTHPLDMSSYQALSKKTGSLRQIASVRRMILQDGPESGLETLSFSTGGGLQFWALPGRSLDIGPLWFNGQPVSWEHPTGFAAAPLHDAASDNGTGIERSLSGFLVTCGFENTRRPNGPLPQHGHLPATPARLRAFGEDWHADVPVLFAEGDVVVAHLDGPCYQLRRRLEAPIGGSSLTLTDTVENIGVDQMPLFALYHFNLGYPFLDDTSRLRVGAQDVPVAADRDGFVTCFPQQGQGGKRDLMADVTGGPMGATLLRIEGNTKALPYLQVWRDPRDRRNILSVEPTNADRAKNGTSIPNQVLDPGETWHASLTLTFASTD